MNRRKFKYLFYLSFLAMCLLFMVLDEAFSGFFNGGSSSCEFKFLLSINLKLKKITVSHRLQSMYVNFLNCIVNWMFKRTFN